MSEFLEKKIDSFFSECKNILLERNKEYGNSALKPRQIFSKASPVEVLEQQIDHKLSRIAEGDRKKDTLMDIVNYILLLDIAMNDKEVAFKIGPKVEEEEQEMTPEEAKAYLESLMEASY